MTNLSSESPTQLSTKPVRRSGVALMLARVLGPRALMSYAKGGTLTFAHVLNVPETEVVWPGEAVNIFLLPSTFLAVSPDTGRFVREGPVNQHMRCETLRLCVGENSALHDMMEELSLRLQFGGPFPSYFEDSYDDEGELLLTNELDF